MPTLQHALPALKRLFTYWERSAGKACYEAFVPALNAGMAKLNDYYKQSAKSDTHIMAMSDVFKNLEF
jgi:hypothetical protein